MHLKICIFFAACVSAHPVQQQDKNPLDKSILDQISLDKTTSNKISSNAISPTKTISGLREISSDKIPLYKKLKIPTVAEVKALEKEIWKATSSGDFTRALKLENRLEADILKAALGVLAQSKKDPIRSRRDLGELGSIVRRDKRTVKFLSTIVTAGAQSGLNFLFSNTKNKIQAKGYEKEENGTLKRIPRQGNPLQISLRPPYFVRRSDKIVDASLNEIVSPSTSISPPLPSFNLSEISITTSEPEMNSITTTQSLEMLEDSVTAGSDDSRKEEVTTRVPERQKEEDEDEGGGGLGGLITSFLGSLSTPEGGIDLDAVTGLLGGISTQNDDGTFDFTGLQDTVGSLFGGAEEGGSNVGQFLGGLLGATIRGSAGDAGAKGAGRLAGNLITALLPGLSAYPTPEDENAKPMEGLDSGGFLKGFLSTVLGGLAGLSNSNSSGGGGDYGKPGGSGGALLQIKFQLLKAAFSIISKILGASSSSKQTPQYGTGTDYYGPPPPQN